MTSDEQSEDRIESEEDRIARLIAELDELDLDEREAAIAALPVEDREAVWAAEAEASEAVLPEPDEAREE